MRGGASRPVTVAALLRWLLKYIVVAWLVALLAILVAGLFKRKVVEETEPLLESFALERLEQNDRCNAILAISPDLQGQLDEIGLMPERGSLHG
ncbi:MAG: hypothetical protein ABGZ31_06160, partial [Roseibacillus sp.]